MPIFRKKPVEIEARQLTPETALEIMAWCGAEHWWTLPPFNGTAGIIVPTLEGHHEAGFGDWIIKGIKGEFYPCKPDIFAATYDEVA